MADTWFSAKEWKARLVEFAGRRSLRNVANGETATYDVSRSEGQVSQEGDAFNTKNMNDLEQRISNGFANAKTNIDALNRDLKFPDGVGFYPDIQDGVRGYNTDPKRGADTFIPFRADEVAMFEITIPNTTEDNILVTVTDKLGFKDAPNVIFVSAANHLTIDAIYNPYKTITTDAKTMVKLCAYAPTQKIEYREVAEVFPTITKDSIAIKAKAFVSGVGDKVAHVVIARFV